MADFENKDLEQQEQDDKNLSVEELMEQLAKANEERDRYKRSNDKLSKEAAESKRALRQKLTAEEQAKADAEEAQKQRDEEIQNIIKENARLKATSAYKGLSEDSVENLISAVADSDHKTIAMIIEAERKAAAKTAVADFLKSRPDINAGTGDSKITKEQFNAMSLSEKSKLYRENIAEYNRLNS